MSISIRSYANFTLASTTLIVSIVIVIIVRQQATESHPNIDRVPRTLITAYDSYATPAARLSYVNSLYLADRIQDVRDISSLMLSRDSGDIGALLLMLECDIKQVRPKDLVKTIDRLLPLLEKIDSKSLDGKRDGIIRRLTILKMGAATMTDQQIRDDLEMQRKRLPTPMVYEDELKMLAKDGLF